MMGGRPILFRFDADPITGYGHLVRSMALARRLERKGFLPVFLAGPDRSGESRRLLQRNANVRWLPEGYGEQDEARVAEELIGARRPAGAVVDLVRSNRRLMEIISGAGVALLAIDDEYTNNHRADIVVNPSVWAEARAYAASGARALVGPEYLPLRPEFAQAARERRAKQSGRVFVSFGGSDPASLALKTLEALPNTSAVTSVVVMAGRASADHEKLAATADELKIGVEIHRGSEEPWRIMADAAMAVCSIGATTWELACLGTPAILATVGQGQAKNAEELDRRGIAIHFARDAAFEPRALAGAIDELVSDTARLAAMSEKCRALVDGGGVERVAAAFTAIL